jgi:hypothetical protein
MIGLEYQDVNGGFYIQHLIIDETKNLNSSHPRTIKLYYKSKEVKSGL